MKVNVEVTCTPEEAPCLLRPAGHQADAGSHHGRNRGTAALEPRRHESGDGVQDLVAGVRCRAWNRCSRCSRRSGRSSPISPPAARRIEPAMSQREKPSDPKPYYEAHVFCCTNRRPAGHPRGCCAEEGQRGVARSHEEPRQGPRPQERAHQQRGLPRSLRARAERVDLSRRRLVFLRDQGRHRRGAAEASGRRAGGSNA